MFHPFLLARIKGINMVIRHGFCAEINDVHDFFQVFGE
jgi:hypothetical protein